MRDSHPTSLAGALFTTTQQRVLAALFGEPKRRFMVTELIAQTGGGGAIQRELNRLESAGIVTSTREGRQRLVQINRSCPIHAELGRIVHKTLLIAPALEKALAPLRDRIEFAFIYGSVARQADHAGSDIDLMVISAQVGLADLYPAITPAEQSLGRPVKPTIYTMSQVAQRLSSNNAFMGKVINQLPKQWLLGDEAGLRKALDKSPDSRGSVPA